MSKKCGVYKVISLSTDRIYIGSAKDFVQRRIRHLSSLRKNKHSNNHLQKIYNKYGEYDLKFIFLESCEEKDLQHIEQNYIDKYGIENLINIRKKAYSAIDYKPSDKTKMKISRSHKSAENVKKRSELTKRLWQDENYRKKVIESRIKRFSDKDFIEKRDKTFKSDEYRKKRSKIAKELWENKEFRNKLEVCRKSQCTEDVKKKLSKRAKERWTKEERDKQSKRVKERWEKKEISEETRKKLSISAKESWKKRRELKAKK